MKAILATALIRAWVGHHRPAQPVARRGEVAGCIVRRDRGSQFRGRKFHPWWGSPLLACIPASTRVALGGSECNPRTGCLFELNSCCSQIIRLYALWAAGRLLGNRLYNKGCRHPRCMQSQAPVIRVNDVVLGMHVTVSIDACQR